MRKKIAVILVFATFIALFACNRKQNDTSPKAEAASGPAPAAAGSAVPEEDKAGEKQVVTDMTESGEELFSHFIEPDREAGRLVSDMVEVFNGSVFATGLESVSANWSRAGNTKAATEALEYAKSKIGILKDQEMKGLLAAAIDEYEKYISEKKPGSEEENKENEGSLKAVPAFYEALSKKYAVENFVKVKPEDFFKTKDLTPFAKELEPIAKDDNRREKLLKKIADEKDFNKKNVYALLLISLPYNLEAKNPVFEAIFREHKYSPFTQKLWNLWRGAYQEQFNGVTGNSEIDNRYYNSMRREVALGILNELEKNPENRFAVIDFIMTASAQNILRSGLFGNSAAGGTTSVPDFGFKIPELEP